MKIKDTLLSALRRLAGGVPERRRTLALPGVFTAPRGVDGALPKCTPYNLRRFAETPIARKAINTIKDRVAGMRWRIQPKNGRDLGELPGGAERDRNLLGRFTARTFVVPRITRVIDVYVRQYDGSSPRKYSRDSTALHVDYPL